MSHSSGAPLALALCAAVVSSDAAGSDPALTRAVKARDRQAVRAALRPDTVTVPEPDGTTALHWAVRDNDAEIVELLLRGGADVRVANRYGVTPLSLTAQDGNAALAVRLLDAGADPNTTRAEGDTVLMTAAPAGSEATVRALLARGADVHAREEWLGQTALMMAAAENHAEVIHPLVEGGADVNARSSLTNLPDLKRGVGGMSTTAGGRRPRGALHDDRHRERGPDEGRTRAGGRPTRSIVHVGGGGATWTPHRARRSERRSEDHAEVRAAHRSRLHAAAHAPSREGRHDRVSRREVRNAAERAALSVQLADRLLPAEAAASAEGNRAASDGTRDNSPVNKWNPDPTAEVHCGDQRWQDILSAPTGVIVDRNVDPRTGVDCGGFRKIREERHQGVPVDGQERRQGVPVNRAQ